MIPLLLLLLRPSLAEEYPDEAEEATDEAEAESAASLEEEEAEGAELGLGAKGLLLGFRLDPLAKFNICSITK